ncbi:DUF488 family protein [Streptomyces gardneri]|nr:DUF488 family protein [Streptomyces gardneri]
MPVDRLGPKDVTEAVPRVDRWPEALAPSTELRRWFHADRDARGPQFAHRYRAELAALEVQQDLRELRALAAEGPVTLLTAVQDPVHSHVPGLLDLLGRVPATCWFTTNSRTRLSVPERGHGDRR